MDLACRAGGPSGLRLLPGASVCSVPGSSAQTYSSPPSPETLAGPSAGEVGGLAGPCAEQGYSRVPCLLTQWLGSLCLAVGLRKDLVPAVPSALILLGHRLEFPRLSCFRMMSWTTGASAFVCLPWETLPKNLGPRVLLRVLEPFQSWCPVTEGCGTSL